MPMDVGMAVCASRGSRADDRGGIVLGWLLRLTVALVALGVLAFDVFSLAYANVTTVEDAGIVAGRGAQQLIENPNAVNAARAVSLTQAEELGVGMRAQDWWVDETGEVHVTVSREARTLILAHIPPLQKYLTVRAVGAAPSF